MVELISGPFVIRWGYDPILVNNLRLAQVAVCVNWVPKMFPRFNETVVFTDHATGRLCEASWQDAIEYA